MRGFVGIDVGVFDDDLRTAGSGPRAVEMIEEFLEEHGPVEEEVDEARRRRFETGDSGDGTDIVDDFLCNLSRRFAQDSGQLERKGQCQVAHFDAGRSLHGQIGCLHPVVTGQEVAEMVSDLRDSGLKHTRVS